MVTTYRRVNATLILILSSCKTWYILGCFYWGDCPIIPPSPRLLPKLTWHDLMGMGWWCPSVCNCIVIVCSELCLKFKGLVPIYHCHSLQLDLDLDLDLARVKYWKATKICNDNEFTPQLVRIREEKPVRCDLSLWSLNNHLEQWVYLFTIDITERARRYVWYNMYISVIWATNN